MSNNDNYKSNNDDESSYDQDQSQEKRNSETVAVTAKNDKMEDKENADNNNNNEINVNNRNNLVRSKVEIQEEQDEERGGDQHSYTNPSETILNKDPLGVDPFVENQIDLNVTTKSLENLDNMILNSAQNDNKNSDNSDDDELKFEWIDN